MHFCLHVRMRIVPRLDLGDYKGRSTRYGLAGDLLLHAWEYAPVKVIPLLCRR
jgi:hypothetical protein